MDCSTRKREEVKKVRTRKENRSSKNTVGFTDSFQWSWIPSRRVYVGCVCMIQVWYITESSSA
jgi:hypothetical protein